MVKNRGAAEQIFVAILLLDCSGRETAIEGKESDENESRDIQRGGGGLSVAALYQFTQQDLPACKPVLTPKWVISTFFITGIIFIPMGFLFLHASRSVVEIVDRYDTECIPVPFRNTKAAYIVDDSVPKNCTRYLKVPKHMKAPIYIYYQLDNYYQNHRRYVKSRSDQQLLHGLRYNTTGSCKPEDTNNGLPIVPCGLIAWSLFNDTYDFSRGVDELKVNRKNIAWRSDRDHKFGKHVYPFNFQNGSLIGGAKLDPSIPLSDQEDLIVWMRTAALPTFRKLYGRIEEDLDAGPSSTILLLRMRIPTPRLPSIEAYLHCSSVSLYAPFAKDGLEIVRSTCQHLLHGNRSNPTHSPESMGQTIFSSHVEFSSYKYIPI
nr:putative ALA-interacting subunit 2 isoform X1 [Ipomoea batatas]